MVSAPMQSGRTAAQGAMMIIWGSKVRETRAATGSFFCPSCRDEQSYGQRKVSRYFILYFIPLFPMGRLGDFVRCGGCRGEFKSTMLQHSREQILEALQPWACDGCGNRNPSSSAVCVGCQQPRAA